MKKLLLTLATLLAFSMPAFAAVNLNTATQAELETVDGIGPKKAQAIIDYRKKNGSFKSVDELDNVPGFGKKTVDTLRKDITVGNVKAAAAGKPEKTAKEAKPTPAAPAKPATPVATPAATNKSDKKK